jgi:hypothetical protein
MLPRSKEFSVMCKVIRSSDIDLNFGVWESVTDSHLRFGSGDGLDDPLA